jgi:hypothetical protein
MIGWETFFIAEAEASAALEQFTAITVNGPFIPYLSKWGMNGPSFFGA